MARVGLLLAVGLFNVHFLFVDCSAGGQAAYVLIVDCWTGGGLINVVLIVINVLNVLIVSGLLYQLPVIVGDRR